MPRLAKYFAVALVAGTVGAAGRCDVPECIEIAGPCGTGGTSGGGSGRFLIVTTVTTGEDIDPDGYIVRITRRKPLGGSTSVGYLIGVNETKEVDASSGRDGDHVVELDGVADNCSVGQENPRSINIVLGEEAPTMIFEVSCTAISP